MTVFAAAVALLGLPGPAPAQEATDSTGTEATAGASPILDVHGTQVRALVVGVPAPIVEDDGPGDAWLAEFDGRVRGAIGFHGALKPLERAAELGDDSPLDELDPRPWRTAGAELVLRTGVRQQDGVIVLDAYLFDVAEAASVWSRRYRLRNGGADQLADAVAGAIVEQLLGVPSPFDRPIVFQYRNPEYRWRELYTTDWAGSEPVQRSRGQRLILNPTWVPDERAVLAVGYRHRVPALTVFDLGPGTEREVFRSTSNIHGPAAFPGSGKAVVAWEQGANTDLYMVDLATGERDRLTTSTAADLSPTVSPDGKHVVFVSDRRGNPYLYRLELATGEVEPLVLEGNYLGEPDYSPDGERIAFVRSDKGTGFAIWVKEFKSGRIHRISDFGGDSLESPTWAPDGRTVIYSRLKGGSYDLWKVDRLLKESRQLTRFPGDARMPDWAPAASR